MCESERGGRDGKKICKGYLLNGICDTIVRGEDENMIGDVTDV